MPFHKNHIWQTQEAKAEFAKVVKDAQESDQFITKRGEVVAVLMSSKRYEKLKKHRASFINFFKKAPLPEVDIEIERSGDLPREIDL